MMEEERELMLSSLRAARAVPAWHLNRRSALRWAGRWLTGDGSGDAAGLQAQVAAQGAKVRAIKAARKADTGSPHTAADLAAEVAVLKALKTQLEGAGSGATHAAEADAQARATGDVVSGPDDESYRRQRWTELEAHEQGGHTVFPHTFAPTHRIPEFLNTYEYLAPGEQASEAGAVLDTMFGGSAALGAKLEEVRVAGRIYAVRRSGKNLVFLDLRGDGARLQLMCDKTAYRHGDWGQLLALIKRGDIVGATGTPARNQRGELCVIPTDVCLLSPCVRLLPKEHYGLKDPDARFRNRHVDLLANAGVRKVFEKRAAVLRAIREFLDAHSFLEVETPVLAATASGAAARPFSTEHNALGNMLHMRVAPELYLKRLVVGGMDRVYEMGKCFRNEGVDATHNPEFTSVEVYQAYADYQDMMVLTEDLLAHVARRVVGSTIIGPSGGGGGAEETGEGGGAKGVRLDFGGKFPRVDYMTALAEAAGEEFPPADELTSTESMEFLRGLALRHGVAASAEALPASAAGLLDKLCSTLVEPKLVQPTFLVHQPVCMSPLAKCHRSRPGVSERFELFVLGKELCNAYTELNDPREQAARFEQQQADKSRGDAEALAPDDDFVAALEYGLAPTAGWGLGVDRLCMTLLGLSAIREVLLFPILRPRT